MRRDRDAVASLEEAIDWFRKSRNVAWLNRAPLELEDVLREAGQQARAELVAREATELLDRARGTENEAAGDGALRRSAIYRSTE